MDKRNAFILATLVIWIIKYRTVNLTKLIVCLWVRTKQSSRYRKLQRFFWNVRFNERLLAKFLAGFAWKGPWVLSMDRTNWKYGKVNINILTIWIVYKWISIPILRRLLDKRWNSHTEERIEIVWKFIEIFKKEDIGLLLADREFIGKEWLMWLLSSRISFIIRVRNNTKVEGYWWERQILNSFKNDKRYSPKALRRKRKIWWIDLYITWMKTKDEYLIVVSDKYVEDAIKAYWERREIETLFWCLKTRWFCFEETHLQDRERIWTMMWVLCIAFVWSHAVWEEREKQEPIKIKKHGRKAVSIFRYGLQLLRDFFENIWKESTGLEWTLDVLYCT